MTTPHNFAKITVWGHANHKKFPRRFFPLPLNTHFHTSTLHYDTKLLNPT